MTAERNLAMLKQIADTLGVSIDYFSKCRAQVEGVADHDAHQQASELLKAFADITDVKVRRECIEHVRTQRDKPLS